MNKVTNVSFVLGVLIMLAGCATNNDSVLGAGQTTETDMAEYTQCSDPRPEICTQEYNPVCAIKKVDAQCVTTPCEPTEHKTYSTGCTACADSSVTMYKPGACETE